MIDKPRLEAKCSTWNITLTGTQLDQLDAFAEILVDYNQKVNLTPRGSRISTSSTACCLPASRKWRAAWWMWAQAQASRAS